MKEWIEKAQRDNPDSHYTLRVTALYEIMEYADEAGLSGAIVAAYNHGFQRGRNYERNHRKCPTIKEIKAAVLWGEGKEQECRQALLDAFREQFTIENAAELITCIMDSTGAEAAKDPEAAAEWESFTTTERILWAVKEAFCAGQVDGHYMAQEVTKAQLEALERK